MTQLNEYANTKLTGGGGHATSKSALTLRAHGATHRSGLDELLENLLHLVAESDEYTANPNRSALGPLRLPGNSEQHNGDKGRVAKNPMFVPKTAPCVSVTSRLPEPATTTVFRAAKHVTAGN